jgi:hypothetical protein
MIIEKVLTAVGGMTTLERKEVMQFIVSVEEKSDDIPVDHLVELDRKSMLLKNDETALHNARSVITDLKTKYGYTQ